MAWLWSALLTCVLDALQVQPKAAAVSRVGCVWLLPVPAPSAGGGGGGGGSYYGTECCMGCKVSLPLRSVYYALLPKDARGFTPVQAVCCMHAAITPAGGHLLRYMLCKELQFAHVLHRPVDCASAS